jgi:hypothetical protein
MKLIEIRTSVHHWIPQYEAIHPPIQRDGHLGREGRPKTQSDQAHSHRTSDTLQFSDGRFNIVFPARQIRLRHITGRVSGTKIVEAENVKARAGQLARQLAKGPMRIDVLGTPRVADHRPAN